MSYRLHFDDNNRDSLKRIIFTFDGYWSHTCPCWNFGLSEFIRCLSGIANGLPAKHPTMHYGKPYLIITIWKVFLVTDMKSFQTKSSYGDKYHHMNAWSERWIFSFSDQDGDWFELFSNGDMIKWWQIWFEMKSQIHFKWWHDQMVTFCVW